MNPRENFLAGVAGEANRETHQSTTGITEADKGQSVDFVTKCRLDNLTLQCFSVVISVREHSGIVHRSENPSCDSKLVPKLNNSKAIL
jgi:hypothetical protein